MIDLPTALPTGILCHSFNPEFMPLSYHLICVRRAFAGLGPGAASGNGIMMSMKR
jgi:hypothetical protein